MNVIVVLGNDATNLSIEPIVRKLQEKHCVRIFAENLVQQNIDMFSDIRGKIKPINTMTGADKDWADCVFCSVLSIKNIQNIKKYIFTFCHMNPRFDPARGSDFVFTLTDLKDSGPIHFASLPVGIAKNDVTATAVPKKQILYIDAGHFPFGKRGQRQIAQMLLDICKAHSDYTVCVKPRWFPATMANGMSNPNYGHIYNEIDELADKQLPDNLLLLHEYRNMQELIDESECVISSATSAYLDAAIRQRPLLIIKGIDNEDMFHLRDHYFTTLYEFAEKSGCVVDYRDILSYLPQGKICNTDHIKDAFAFTKGVADRVVDAMEFIVEDYVLHGIYPDIKEYRYESLKTDISCVQNLSMSDLLANRMFVASETASLMCQKISLDIDWSEFFRQQYFLCQLSVRQKIPYKKLEAYVTDVKLNYVVDHKTNLTREMDVAYLYMAMFKLGKHDQLMSAVHKSSQPLCETLNYYAGIIEFAHKEYLQVREYLLPYFRQSFSHSFPKYHVDAQANRSTGFYAAFSTAMALEDSQWLDELIHFYLEHIRFYPIAEYTSVRLLKCVFQIFSFSKKYSDESLKASIKELKAYKPEFYQSAAKHFRSSRKKTFSLAKKFIMKCVRYPVKQLKLVL